MVDFIESSESSQILTTMGALGDPSIASKFQAWKQGHPHQVKNDTELVQFYKFLIDRAILIFEKKGFPTHMLCDIAVAPVVVNGNYTGRVRLLSTSPETVKIYTDKIGALSNTCRWIADKLEKR